MKKIGIITISRTNNYGAELQAYASQKKIQLLGYDAELIDYLYYKHKDHKPTKKSEPVISRGNKEKIKDAILYRFISPFYENFLCYFIKKINLRKKNFKSFHKNTKYSSEYRSVKDLYNAKHEYDVFIAGSDQIWNPGTGTSVVPYFLDFAPKDKYKMSYASSFGVSEIDKEYYPLYQKYISNLDAVGVREDDGVKIVKETSGVDATRVLDPTLLLNKEEWSEVIDVPINRKKKYVVIYSLHESETLIKIAYYLQEKLDLEIIKLTKRAYSNKEYTNIINIEDQGPSGYVDLFMNATFVLTNSFHGTAFSTNFNIPFFAVLNRKKKNNSRMINFLKMVGLSERIIWDEIPSFDVLDEIIDCDFSHANKILESQRNDSVTFLKKNIDNN